MKALQINEGKGFTITFDNGVSVSIQFGYGNYCDNYSSDKPFARAFELTQRSLGAKGTSTAETALMDKHGFIPYKGGDVQGNQSAADILKTLKHAARLKPRRKKEAW